jgi:broad specificity phosphatase PhoE
MAWGRFEGRRLADLRREDPDGMAANEALGLDFRPPCGESPREVAGRLAGLARSLAGGIGPVVAVTHKGVLRAALVLATGWDLRTRPPLGLERGDALALAVDGGGRISLAGPPLRLGTSQG